MHLLVSWWLTLLSCLQPQELQRLQGPSGNTGPKVWWQKPPRDYQLIEHSVKSVGSELNCEVALLHEDGFGEEGRDKWRVFSLIVTSPRL